MKIRIGFVSNSSTSSFLIAGIGLPSDEDEFVSFIRKKFKKEYDECNGDRSEFFYNHKFEYTGDEDGDYVGIDFDEWDENLTINQIKQEAFEKLSKILDIEKEDVHICYGATYNG